MSTSGNMIPQSTTRMRSSTSRQKQLRPISPNPPRKTNLTAASDCIEEDGGTRLIGGEGYPTRATGPRERSSSAPSGADGKGGVLLAGVRPVLELDDAELGEAGAQPSVARVEEPELLAVGHDLGEQHRLEDRSVGRLLHRLHRLLHVDTEPLPRLLLHEPVSHADRGLERELLTLPDLGPGELLVELLQR